MHLISAQGLHKRKFYKPNNIPMYLGCLARKIQGMSKQQCLAWRLSRPFFSHQGIKLSPDTVCPWKGLHRPWTAARQLQEHPTLTLFVRVTKSGLAISWDCELPWNSIQDTWLTIKYLVSWSLSLKKVNSSWNRISLGNIPFWGNTCDPFEENFT